jgi:CheY-like chemotaxis protein
MPKALVVENAQDLKYTTSQHLEFMGFEVSTVSSGEEALALLSENRDWQAFVTEIGLPGQIDGWHFAQLAMLLVPGLHVIYTSSFCETSPELSRQEFFLDQYKLPLDIASHLQLPLLAKSYMSFLKCIRDFGLPGFQKLAQDNFVRVDI